MTDRLWLVRHASTDWTGRRYAGRSDLPLSAAGRAEAAALGEALASVLPADVAILSSPARRAAETAGVIAAALAGSCVHAPIDVLDDLWEVDFGDVEGLTWRELERDHAELARVILAGRPVDWPGGETVAQLRRRVGDVVARLGAATRPVVIVAHGILIAELIAALTDADAAPRTLLAPATTMQFTKPSDALVWRVSGVGA